MIRAADASGPRRPACNPRPAAGNPSTKLPGYWRGGSWRVGSSGLSRHQRRSAASRRCALAAGSSRAKVRSRRLRSTRCSGLGSAGSKASTSCRRSGRPAASSATSGPTGVPAGRWRRATLREVGQGGGDQLAAGGGGLGDGGGEGVERLLRRRGGGAEAGPGLHGGSAGGAVREREGAGLGGRRGRSGERGRECVREAGGERGGNPRRSGFVGGRAAGAGLRQPDREAERDRGPVTELDPAHRGGLQVHPLRGGGDGFAAACSPPKLPPLHPAEPLAQHGEKRRLPACNKVRVMTEQPLPQRLVGAAEFRGDRGGGGGERLALAGEFAPPA